MSRLSKIAPLPLDNLNLEALKTKTKTLDVTSIGSTDSTWVSSTIAADDKSAISERTTSTSSITTTADGCSSRCSLDFEVTQDASKSCTDPAGLVITIDDEDEKSTTSVDASFKLAQARISKIGQWEIQRNKDKRNHHFLYPSFSNERSQRTDNQQEDDSSFLFNNRLVKNYFDYIVGMCNSCKSTPFVFPNDFSCDDRDDIAEVNPNTDRETASDSRDASSSKYDDDEVDDDDDNVGLNRLDELNETLLQMELEESEAEAEMMSLKYGLAFDLDEQRDDLTFHTICIGNESRCNILQQSTPGCSVQEASTAPERTNTFIRI